ncbi:MAG: ribosome biogenesis GTP-binding protein YihA/YsxC [Mariprofundales bacterium]
MHWAQVRFIQSVADISKFPKLDELDSAASIAVAGHSNVGKSSLLNALLGRHGMAKVSKKPGHTRLLNLFAVDEKLLLVDLPGYGFARAPKNEQKRWRRLIQHYLLYEHRPQCVLVLLDIRHGPKDSDLQLIHWLNEIGLRWYPIATKADKLSGNSRSKRQAEMRRALGGITPLLTSVSDGRGINDLRSLVITACGIS